MMLLQLRGVSAREQVKDRARVSILPSFSGRSKAPGARGPTRAGRTFLKGNDPSQMRSDFRSGYHFTLQTHGSPRRGVHCLRRKADSGVLHDALLPPRQVSVPRLEDVTGHGWGAGPREVVRRRHSGEVGEPQAPTSLGAFRQAPSGPHSRAPDTCGEGQNPPGRTWGPESRRDGQTAEQRNPSLSLNWEGKARSFRQTAGQHRDPWDEATVVLVI